jgi:WD40 repeat protein
LQTAGKVDETSGYPLLVQQELIFMERLELQGADHPRVQWAARQLQTWAMYFHNDDIRIRVGQRFYQVYSKEKKSKFEEDDPRRTLEHFHLAASLNDASYAIEIFKATGFPLDEKVPVSNQLSTEFNTVLETCAWYSTPTSDAAFASLWMEHYLPEPWPWRSSEIAARRGCDSLLHLFEAHHPFGFQPESYATLYCLATLGGHSRTAELLLDRVGSHSGRADYEIRDPIDGSIHRYLDVLSFVARFTPENSPPLSGLRIALTPERDDLTEETLIQTDSRDEFQNELSTLTKEISALGSSRYSSNTLQASETKDAMRTSDSQESFTQCLVLNGGIYDDPNHLDLDRQAPATGFFHQGSRVHSILDDGTFISWASTSGSRLSTFKMGLKKKKSSAFVMSPNGKEVAYQRAGLGSIINKGLVVVSISSGAQLCAFNVDLYSDICALAFSPNGRTLASGTRNGALKLHGVASAGYSVVTLKDRYPISTLVFSPNGRLLASVGSGFTIYDVETRVILFQTQDYATSHRLGAAFSPDSCKLATTQVLEEGNVVEIWDIINRRRLSRLNGHQGWGHKGLSFSPNGRLLVAASENHSVCMWDLSTEKVIHTWEGHKTTVECVEFSPDGKMVISSSADRAVRLWKLPLHLELKGVESIEKAKDEKPLNAGKLARNRLPKKRLGRRAKNVASSSSPWGPPSSTYGGFEY